MHYLQRAPPRKLTQKWFRVYGGKDFSLPPDDLIDRITVFLQIPLDLHEMQPIPRCKLQSVKWMLAGVKSGRARYDWPVVLQPFANGWNRAAVPQCVTRKVVCSHGINSLCLLVGWSDEQL